MRGYGWRARIGHVYPAVVAETLLTEFYRIAPPGVTLALNNLVIESLNQKEGIEESIARIDQCAGWLAKRKVDIIVIGGKPILHHLGDGSGETIIARLEKKFGIPVTTTHHAVIASLRKLGARKLAVASPYFDEQNAQIKHSLEREGFEVVIIKGLDTELENIHALPLEASYRHAKNCVAEAPSAEAVYIPCPHFAVPHLQELEDDLGVPVVNGIASLLWHSFDLLQIHAPIQGHGRLLASLSP